MLRTYLNENQRDRLRFLASRFLQHKQEFFRFIALFTSATFLRNACRSFNFWLNTRRTPKTLSSGTDVNIEFLQICQEINIEDGSSRKLPKIGVKPQLYGRPKIWYQPVRPSWLRDVYIANADSIYITKSGRIFDSGFRSLFKLWNRREYKLLQNLRKVLLGVEIPNTPEEMPLFSELLSVSQTSSEVYGHFLVEVLPRLSLVNQKKYEHLPIYMAIDHDIYKEVLLLLDIPENRIIDATEHPIVKAEKAIIPIYHHAGNSFLPDFGVEIITRLKSRVLASYQPRSKLNKKLYIRKSGSDNRRIINEAEVVRVLEAYGFVSISPPDFSFKEQVSIFANADWVIGEHGSGMFNCVFCSRNAWVVDLFPGCVNTGLYKVLAPLGIQYKAMLSPEISFSVWKYHLSFKVDIDEFKKMLKKAFSEKP